ncbi:Hypothetical protein NTJ_02679 [Nesidiocoris tenuis]|uniref:Uncharacterized protein n=1 Tax=Nesidiocoris tenuis TaxID=355587 RepID=A0ABN7AHR8_9HEMI|nr:Hypothetical protein NTJ_02679 [Nesidiocoris tenuis]
MQSTFKSHVNFCLTQCQASNTLIRCLQNDIRNLERNNRREDLSGRSWADVPCSGPGTGASDSIPPVPRPRAGPSKQGRRARKSIVRPRLKRPLLLDWRREFLERGNPLAVSGSPAFPPRRLDVHTRLSSPSRERPGAVTNIRHESSLQPFLRNMYQAAQSKTE